MRQHCETIGRKVHVVNLGEYRKRDEEVTFSLCRQRLFSSLSQPLPLSFFLKKKNSDPAAEDFAYPVAFDVRDLITVEDAMEELGLGPNG